MPEAGKSPEQLLQEIRSLRQRLAEMDRRITESQPVFLVVDALFKGILGDLRQTLYRINHQTGRMEFVSSSVESVLGIPPKHAMEMTEEEVFLRVHPEDLNAVRLAQDDHERRLRTDPTIPGIVQCRWWNGREYIWIRNRFLIILDRQGRRFMETGIIEDVTDRVQAEEKLRKIEADRKLILESVSELVVYHDRNMDIVWVNRAAAESVNHTPDELVGKKCYAIWHQRTTPCEGCPVMQALKTGQPGEFEVTSPDGRMWFIRGYPAFDTGGQLIGATEVCWNITDRKRAEQARQKAHEELEHRVAERTADLRAANEQLREAHLQLLNAREEERRTLASELHDSIAQDMVVLQLVLQCVAKSQPGSTKWRDSLGEAIAKCSDMIGEIRHICHGLYPPMLETLGLCRSLRSLADYYHIADRQVTVEWACGPEDRRFPREIEITLFRIAQEALCNAVRHGQARYILVRVSEKQQHAVLEVEDDGKGFDARNENNGLGLQSMRDRAGLVAGRLEIDSQAGRTCIRVEMPMEQQTDNEAKRQGSPL